MNFFSFVKQDWLRNHNNTRGRFVTILFRMANYSNNRKIAKILLMPYLIFYKFFVQWVLGVGIPYNVIIGKGLKVYYWNSLIINYQTVIGENCTIRQSTTIGNKSEFDKSCPIIGNNVNIGANVCIIGNIKVGDNVVIGAGSVVTKDIPANCIVVGNPAKIIKTI